MSGHDCIWRDRYTRALGAVAGLAITNLVTMYLLLKG